MLKCFQQLGLIRKHLKRKRHSGIVTESFHMFIAFLISGTAVCSVFCLFMCLEVMLEVTLHKQIRK